MKKVSPNPLQKLQYMKKTERKLCLFFFIEVFAEGYGEELFSKSSSPRIFYRTLDKNDFSLSHCGLSKISAGVPSSRI